MCDVCKPCSKIWDASQEMLSSRVTNQQTGYPMFIIIQGSTNPQNVNIQVRYCPWCGEELYKDER